MGEATVRAFISSPVEPDRPLRRLLDVVASWGRSFKVVPAAKLHLTWRFLGDVSWESTAAVGERLERIASQFEPIDTSLVGLGVFPHVRRPRVVWVGIDPDGPLQKLAQALDVELGEIGVPRENRPFSPHITVARVDGKVPENFPSLLEKYASRVFQRWYVDQLTLMQSELRRSGAIHTPLSTHDL